jgi:hypothetical protein
MGAQVLGKESGRRKEHRDTGGSSGVVCLDSRRQDGCS